MGIAARGRAAEEGPERASEFEREISQGIGRAEAELVSVWPLPYIVYVAQILEPLEICCTVEGI